jgi:hypothetical protein
VHPNSLPHSPTFISTDSWTVKATNSSSNGTAINTTSAYSKQENDRILAEMRTKMEIMDTNITELRLKGQGLATDAKATWEAKMVTLDEKRKLANAQLEEIGKSSSRAWVDVENGAKAAWQELSHAFQDAMKEF